MALRGQIICPECCNLLKSIAFEHHRKSGFIQILFPWQSSEKAQEALNSHLNCVHFSLTSSEISAADTKEVLKACFDSNRLDSVVFFHSKLKLFIAGEKNPLRVYWVVVVWAMHVLLSLWKHECLFFTLKMKRRCLSCPKSCQSVLLYNSV